ncbi:MAG TPA: class IV adenylate cyclase [Anaerolineales bacterium]|nr:class IV adenylate cyclase [Anaerolineales bacterium]
MSISGQETEAKFYVRDLSRVKSRLDELDARLVQERTLETNIRFDLPGAPLRAEGRVLRLRRDTSTKFTYKSASTNEQGVLSREEIEFGVEDFDKAKRFLEALGYQKLVYYEKFRTTYELNDTLVMLDELPYGNFVEIEGSTVDSIRAIADQLQLNWATAIATSYNALFDRTRSALGISVQDLSFAEFADITVEAAHLGVVAADV